MNRSTFPVTKDVVLVGAGHAHVGVVRAFAMAPMQGVRLTLITRQVHTPYSGMLPGLIAGHYSFDQSHIDAGPLCRVAGARLYNDEVVGLDLAGRRVLCKGRPPVPYDVLSIDIGSAPDRRGIPGAAEHAIPVKPIDGFLARFEAARARVLALGGKARIGVVGAGAGGVELLLALKYRLERDVRAAGHDPAGLAFTILTPSDEVLPALPIGVRRRMASLLKARGVEVRTASTVSAVEAGSVIVNGAERVPLDAIFWTTRAAAAPWLSETGLALDADGFIKVAPTLQSISHPGVFAAGDIAAIEGYALPKSGVYAVRSGPPLAANIRHALDGSPLVPYRPQKDALYLLSAGDRYAIGTRNGLAFEGAWVWRWKDWIDRRFMARFDVYEGTSGLAAMGGPAKGEASSPPDADDMRCGGCAAKVGAGVLTGALRSIAPAVRADVVVGLAAPDDAAVVDVGGPRLAVHTVDYFRAMIDDPYLLGRIAANHALGDLYAMGAEPQSALAIATLPAGPEAKLEDELAQMMSGANEVLREAGCALVGGHTSEGAELAVGFAVNGLVARDRLLRKSGMRARDRLILTKPLGTGLLLAADMRGRARSRWVRAALDVMQVSSREAAAILARHGVRAATDVTGFGLVGHLLEMLRASGVDARIRLADVAVLDGARETLAAGIVSTLEPQNAKAMAAVRNAAEARRHPMLGVLLDPQTAGGLLAAVPAEAAAVCVAELKAAGYPAAADIGEVLARMDGGPAIDIDVSVRLATASAP